MIAKELNISNERDKVKEFEPAIRSLLDLDFYKLSMAQFAHELYPDVQVTYEFKNRKSRIRLADIIPVEQLEEQLRAVEKITISEGEVDYLRSLVNAKGRVFSDEFIDSLRNLKLPIPKITIEDGQYGISVDGSWPEAIFWETYVLSIINELYNRNIVDFQGLDIEEVYLEGDRRLNEKITTLKSRQDIKFIEFGTRRRFSGSWQEYILGRLVNEVPENVVGSSNVYLAEKYNLKPVGTMAHEMFMVATGIQQKAYVEEGRFGSAAEAVRASHNIVLQQWWEMYGEPLSIALTDTFGTDFFFEDMTADQANQWKGLRQDSGDPLEFGQRASAFYESKGIDPKTKVIVFSDGLDMEMMIKLQDIFGDVFASLPFGWGTNLTNDLGIEPLSIVMKATYAEGYSLGKLTDNLMKANGPNDLIDWYVEIFKYGRQYTQDCTY